MFSELELRLLDIAYEALLNEVRLFDNLGQRKEIAGAGVGIEGFIQTKLIDALLNEGYHVTMEGKRKRDCDIIVQDIGIELRAEIRKTTTPTYFFSTFTDHPNADLYLFFSRTEMKSALQNYFEQNGYIAEQKQLNSTWMVCLVKKKNLEPKP